MIFEQAARVVSWRYKLAHTPDYFAARAGQRKSLERIALQDDYFIEKKLFPNIDF